MDNYNSITITNKYKHLSFEHYEYIIREITKHDAFHNGKKRNTGRTALIHSLASAVGTSVSNVYSILNDVIALGAGLGIWGVINLLEGYGNDNPGVNAHVGKVTQLF